ncbi:MAG: DNA polymerase I, partial [Myxococcales bacterium]|nr:DNA polymerase I [Myxococcales bacterium]
MTPSKGTSQRPTLYLVDGSYYIFRAYYALTRLSNSKGFPTNALFGFVGMLNKLMNDMNPSYLAVTFDAKGRSFRHDMYPEYKANRDAPPEDLTPQLPYFREIVEGYNIPCLEIPGVEADDVLGTLTRRAVEQGYDVVLISGDKDLTQLLSEHARMVDTMRDKWMGPAEVKERYSVEPHQMPDILGLMGDTSDNIPGVPGIGEKTAAKLVSQYGSIEGVMENLADFKGKKMGERLAENREQAFLSR